VRAALGFTLVELVTVVVIVGVLATMAAVGFGKMKRSSNVADGQRLVQAIRLAQETYHGEVGRYADISSDLAHNGVNAGKLYPTYTAGGRNSNWGEACGGSCKSGVSWSILPIHNEGISRWGATTVAGPATSNPPAGITLNGTAVEWPDQTLIGSDWFVATAMADINASSDWITVIGSSFSNNVGVDGD